MVPNLPRESAELLANTVQMVRVVDEKDRHIQPRFAKLVDGLRRGIDDASEDEIALYRPQLSKLVGEIDDALNNTQGALHLLGQLRDDKQVMETRFEQIEKLVKLVAGARKRFSDQAAQARKMEHEVEQALAQIRKSDVAVDAELGALQSQMKALMKSTAFADTAAPRCEKAARTAFDKKDQKALTEARTELIGFLRIREDVSAIRARVESFRKAHADLDRERKAEVQWMLDDLERADDTMKRVEKIVKDLVALGQVPKQEKPPAKLGNEEVSKVVKEIGLDANDAPRRAKAMAILNSCLVDKWPKELARLYGAKEAELKAKLGNVRRLPFVKRLELIDI